MLQQPQRSMKNR